VICSAGGVLEIAFNFIALAVVADFDDIVFSSLKNESFSLLLDTEFTQEVLKIQLTTSKNAGDEDLSSLKDQQGNYRKLRVTIKSRSYGNRALYFTYKLLRTTYVSIFFYFMPFAVIILSTILP
jgi:hypothetical protein